MTDEEAPQEITCSGGIKLPALAALFGPRPVPESTSNEAKDETDGE